MVTQCFQQLLKRGVEAVLRIGLWGWCGRASVLLGVAYLS